LTCRYGPERGPKEARIAFENTLEQLKPILERYYREKGTPPTMNRLLRSIVLLFAGSAIVRQVNGCKHNPAPPTEEDAISVWKKTHAETHLQELISLKKTNGQLTEAKVRRSIN
jgi:hypothetical protein